MEKNAHTTKIIPVDAPEAASEALRALAVPGSVILLPTETVYALVAVHGDKLAAERIFALKRRPENRKLGCFAPGIDALDGVEMPEKARVLAERYWPGAMTLILPCTGGDTLGVRIPDHPLLLEILRQSKKLLVQTSANISGAPDARDCRAALEMLDGEVDLAVDGGALPENAKGSTIVDFRDGTPKIVRQGNLNIELEKL